MYGAVKVYEIIHTKGENMKRIVLVVMAVLVVAGQAWADAEWEELGKTDNATIFIDNATFTINDERTVEFWLKYAYTRASAKKAFPKSKKLVSYTVEKNTANCGTSAALAATEFYVYSQNNVIFSNRSYENRALIPGSINKAVHELACGRLALVRMKEEAAAAEQKAAEQAELKKEEERNRIAEAKNQERLKKEEEQRKEEERKTEGLIVTTANEIRHNGKVIFTDKTATDVNVVRKFTISNKEILLVKFDYKGSECDQKYKYFVAYSHGTVTESDMFGDCRPIGYMLNRGDRIETEFEGNGLPKEKIYFDGSQLTKAPSSTGRKAKKAGLSGILNAFK